MQPFITIQYQILYVYPNELKYSNNLVEQYVRICRFRMVISQSVSYFSIILFIPQW